MAEDRDDTLPRKVRLVRLVTIAGDQEALWPWERIQRSRDYLVSTFGRALTPADLYPSMGRSFVDSMVTIVRNGRRIEKLIIEHAGVPEDKWTFELLGIYERCHLCGGEREELGPYRLCSWFGLAKDVKKTKTWDKSLLALAANVLTLPFGIAVAAGPGERVTAQIVKLRLVFCESCARARRSLRLEDYQQHPCLETLYEQGFTTFISSKELDEFSREGHGS